MADRRVLGLGSNDGPEEIKQIKAGTWKASNMRGDLSTGNVVLDSFGPAVPATAQADILKLKEDINSGKKSIWEGPIAKQDGTVVVASGQKLSMEQIETMNYLVKGITGATK